MYRIFAYICSIFHNFRYSHNECRHMVLACHWWGQIKCFFSISPQGQTPICIQLPSHTSNTVIAFQFHGNNSCFILQGPYKTLLQKYIRCAPLMKSQQVLIFIISQGETPIYIQLPFLTSNTVTASNSMDKYTVCSHQRVLFITCHDLMHRWSLSYISSLFFLTYMRNDCMGSLSSVCHSMSWIFSGILGCFHAAYNVIVVDNWLFLWC